MAAPVLDGPQRAPGPGSWPYNSANGSRAEDAFSSSQGNLPKRLKGGDIGELTQLTFLWKEVQGAFSHARRGGHGIDLQSAHAQSQTATKELEDGLVENKA
jgi:hypothetical protein